MQGRTDSLHPGGLAALTALGRAPGYLDTPDCAAASAVAPELSRLSARGVPLQAGGLEVLCRHRDSVMHRRAEVEHQRLGHMRSLAGPHCPGRRPSRRLGSSRIQRGVATAPAAPRPAAPDRAGTRVEVGIGTVAAACGPALSLGYDGGTPQCNPAMVPLGLKVMVTTLGPLAIVTGTCSRSNWPFRANVGAPYHIRGRINKITRLPAGVPKPTRG